MAMPLMWIVTALLHLWCGEYILSLLSLILVYLSEFDYERRYGND